MNDILSQEEIATLFGTGDGGSGVSNETLDDMQTDAIGEIGNISMGTAATTLSQVINRRVYITTPKVEILSINSLSNRLQVPYVLVTVGYRHGLMGNNLLMLKEDDVRIITDLMMGGEGENNGEPLGELHLSAISEAMNQMMGSASTSMSDMLHKPIDITPPSAMVARLGDEQVMGLFDDSAIVVNVSFDMTIEGLINSEIMQLMPVSFARELVDSLVNPQQAKAAPAPKAPAPAAQPVYQPAPQAAPTPAPQPAHQPAFAAEGYAAAPAPAPRPVVDAKPVQFRSFDGDSPAVRPMDDSINLIIDVPMQVTIELGKCRKTVKEILDFNTGTILILDKMAGEPVEVVVNDKLIAKGEVIQIDDNYGVRITEILNTKSRLG